MKHEDPDKPREPRRAKIIPFPAPPGAAAAPAPAPIVPEFPQDVMELLEDYEPEQIELVIEMISRLLQFSSTGAIDKVPMNLSDAERQARAQEAVADAYEAPDDEFAMAALMDALDFDPENVEALLMLVERLAGELPDSVGLYERVLRMAQEQLGPEVFRQQRGNFWAIHETRPYMRARHALARELLYESRPKEAAAHWEEMLELNPNDNQGVRYLLLSVYLTQNDQKGIERLYQGYPGDESFSAPFAWGRVLQRLLAGEQRRAEMALQKARHVNPYLEAYLNGTKRAPKKLPLFYTPHGADEAKIFAADYASAWKKHPEARKWLKARWIPS